MEGMMLADIPECTKGSEANQNLCVFYSIQVMSNQEAIDIIKDIHDPQEAATELIEEAVDRKSTDVISCIVVRLH